MSKEIIVSLLSLGIAIITILSNLIISIISKRYEYKATILKITLESAYKEYEMRTNYEIKRAGNENRESHILSFTEYLIFYSKMTNVINSRKVNSETIKKALKENKEAIDAYYKYREDFRPEYHTQDRDDV